MTWGAIVVGGIGAVSGMINSNKNRVAADKAAEDAEIERNKQQALLKKEKDAYKAMKFENPFANMDNTFEDLTVNQQEAQFQAQQGSQQRANIMQSMKGAAGGSGIAGLAQALANQGQLQTQRISASIGQQESRNQVLAAKGAANVQSLERQGDQYVQQQEANRQATLLGMQMGETSGANMALQTAQANQMNAKIGQQNAQAGLFSVAGQAAGQIDFGGFARQSDPNTGSNVNLTDGGFGIKISGGIKGPKIDQFGNTIFNEY
jgi:hypothetical protein